MLRLSWLVLCGLAVSTSVYSARSQPPDDLQALSNITGAQTVAAYCGLGFCTLMSMLTPYSPAFSAGYVGADPGELALCDCEFATGPPNGLSCEKEGWFVSSFEREGSWVCRTRFHLCCTLAIS